VNVVEQEILSSPSVLRQTLERVKVHAPDLARVLQGPAAFLGCGTSNFVGMAAAVLYEHATGFPAQGIMGSEYVPRRGWSHVAISRTGQTTELIEAMARARAAGASVALIEGESGSPASAHATAVLPLEFAPEQGTIQTRFISASLLALRLLIGGVDATAVLEQVPDQVERGLAEFDPAQLTGYAHIVFLGRGWRYPLALAAAMNLQETARMVPEAQQSLEYRHGPISCADADTLVWSFDAPDDPLSATVLDDVRRTGATVRCTGDDPLVSLIQAQHLAVRIAERRGVSPDAPRHLSRAIVLAAS
jgi:fructoselysine-6-P-deglycase FrlB-like protein